MNENRWIRWSVTAAVALLWRPGLAAASCPVCQRDGCGGQTVTVTNWETNQKETLDCVRCGLARMQQRYPWSRLSVQVADYADPVTVTRTEDRWSVKPEGAVVTVAAEEQCGAKLYATDEGARRAGEKQTQPVLDLVVSLAASAKGAPAAPDTQAAESTGSDASPPPAAPTSAAPSPGGDAIERVLSSGLMKGDPSGEFRPRDSLSRFEMATILDRVLQRVEGGAPPAEKAGEEPPSTTPVTPAAVDAVAAVANELVAHGVAKETVREAVALMPTAAPPAAGAVSPPEDVTPDHWAYEAVMHVYRSGLMEGYPDGSFQGKEPVRRFEIAIILSRLLDRLPALRGTESAETGEVWTCPMHPEIKSNKPGDCPLCGMKLEKVERPAPKPEPAAKPEPESEQLLDKRQAAIAKVEAELRAAGFSEADIEKVVGPLRQLGERPGKVGKQSAALEALRRSQQALAQLQTELARTETIRPPGPERPPRRDLADVIRGRHDRRTETAEKGHAHHHDHHPVRTTSMTGGTGVITAPSGDVSGEHSLSLGFSNFRGVSATHLTLGVGKRLELGATRFAGDLPGKTAINAKLQLWRSGNHRWRLAAGAFDVGDSIDTSPYLALTTTLTGHRKYGPIELSVGAGSGRLMEGAFAGLSAPLTSRLSLQTDVLDGKSLIGGFNAGLEYRVAEGFRARLASTDGELGLGVVYGRRF